MGCKITTRLRDVMPSLHLCRFNNGGTCPEAYEQSIMKSAGAFYIKSGIHRSGYKFRGIRGTNCVIKVPVRESTKSANIAEIEGWKKVQRLPITARRYILEVSDFEKTGDWITQPEVMTLKKLGYTSDDAEDFRNKLSEKGFCDLRDMDIHLNNIGVYKNDVRKRLLMENVKVLDYGMGICFKGKKISSRDEIINKQRKRKETRSSSSSSSITPELFSIF